MVGGLDKLPIAVSGPLVFEKEVTKGGILAILIGFGSGIAYVWAKKRESSAGRRLEKERDIERFEENGFESNSVTINLRLRKVQE
jgi:GDP-mannose transporter